MPSAITRRQAAGALLAASAFGARERPNILWIIGDDLGPQLGCYGNQLVSTPNADKLADEGTRFTHCFTTAPVCSPARSAWNTGVYQTTSGTHNHRSHRHDGYRLPDGIRLISHRLRDAGYFTANVTDIADGVRGSGKTDFNFTPEAEPFQGTHWRQRAKGQPFFVQINFMAPHKGADWPAARKQAKLVDPKNIVLPPENLTRIFSHGFTTRRDGHGFGLHSGANASKQMGGMLWAESQGLGKGATFILELPLKAKDAAKGRKAA